jgi:hypothetical protein
MLALDFSVLLLWIHSWVGGSSSSAPPMYIGTYLGTHPALLLLPWSPAAGHRLKKVPDCLCEDIVRSAEVRVISW